MISWCCCLLTFIHFKLPALKFQYNNTHLVNIILFKATFF